MATLPLPITPSLPQRTQAERHRADLGSPSTAMLYTLLRDATDEGLMRAVVAAWLGLDPTWPTVAALAATYGVNTRTANAAGLRGLRRIRRMQRDAAYQPAAPLASEPHPELDRLLSQLARTDTALATLDQKRETLRTQRRTLALSISRLVYQVQREPLVLWGYLIDEHEVRPEISRPPHVLLPRPDAVTEVSTGETTEAWTGTCAVGETSSCVYSRYVATTREACTRGDTAPSQEENPPGRVSFASDSRG